MSNETSGSNFVIPEYTLLSQIGLGAYGEVWLARGATNAYRAIKLVQRDRFRKASHYEREFDALCRIEKNIRNAPHLVQIHHVGRHDEEGFYYYVMDLADSLGSDVTDDADGYTPATLGALLKAGALDANTALDAAIRLAKGLAKLHGAGMVHRDVKPSNVLFIGGKARLGDLGLLVDELPDTGPLGTEGYVPPEGTGKPTGDLFGLGKIIYEMVTGADRAEFPAIPSEILVTGDWSTRNQLLEIANQCAAPEVGQRYNSADDLLTDLLEVRLNRPILSEKKRINRRRVAAGILAGAAIVLGLIYSDKPAKPDHATVSILSPLGDYDRREQHTEEFERAFHGFIPGKIETWREQNIPPRPPAATSRQLDLTKFYNADLYTTPHVGRNLAEARGNNLKQMPHGLQKFGEVFFDIRGLVILSSQNMEISPPVNKKLPGKVDGIPVGQEATKIHFLHFCSWSHKPKPIAHYRVHYRSGEEISIPIRDGAELQDWWYPAYKFEETMDGVIRVENPDSPVPPTDAKVAWQGSNEFIEPSHMRIRVYHYEWKNPDPKSPIASLTLESNHTPAAPTIIAITVE